MVGNKIHGIYRLISYTRNNRVEANSLRHNPGNVPSLYFRSSSDVTPWPGECGTPHTAPTPEGTTLTACYQMDDLLFFFIVLSFLNFFLHFLVQSSSAILSRFPVSIPLSYASYMSL